MKDKFNNVISYQAKALKHTAWNTDHTVWPILFGEP